MTLIKCGTCKEIKSVESFVRDKNRKNGVRKICKRCKRKASAKWHHSDKGENAYYMAEYGISRETFKQMLFDQKYQCLICGISNNDKQFHIDHCHKTGKVRGLLCWKCNTSLGIVENFLEKALEYLNKNI